MPEQIAVVRFARGWSILADGRWRGRFDFEVDAVDEALKLTVAALREGRRMKLLVQDRFGEMLPLSSGEPSRAAAAAPAEDSHAI